MRHFVYEALKIDRVLVQIHAAPEARRYRRVAHRLLDEQVVETVAESPLRAAIVKALEHRRIEPVLQRLRKQARNDRLPRHTHAQRCDLALRVDCGLQLALRDRMVTAVLHVLFTAPDQLDRRARQLLGDQHRLRDPVMRGAAPAKAPAEQQLGDIAPLSRQARRLDRRSQRAFAVLCGRPDHAALGRPLCCGVHHFHRRMILEGIAVDRLDLVSGRSQSGRRIAMLVEGDDFLGLEPFLEHGRDVSARKLRVRAFVPFDVQRIESGLGMPPGIGHHGHGRLTDLQHLLHAGLVRNRRSIEMLDLATKHRAIANCRVEHAWQLQIHAVDLRAIELVARVQTLERLARERPVLWILERDLGRRTQLGRSICEAAVAGAAP